MSSDGDTGEAEGRTSRRLKVTRLIEDRDLEGMGEDLERRWTGEADTQNSLRELADYFNRHLLRVAMTDADSAPLDGEVENVYRLLADDDVSRGTRTETRRRLERAGVDVEQLESDFVSRQAIHTYLRKARGVEPATDDADQVDKEVERIQKLLTRTNAVVESKLDALDSADHVDFGSVSVTVDLQVFCEDCGVQYSISDLRSNRTCGCRSDQE